jgi:hypothetical protein
MAARGILPRLAAVVTALALGLAGVAVADESAPQSPPAAKVNHGSQGGKTGKRAAKGRK